MGGNGHEVIMGLKKDGSILSIFRVTSGFQHPLLFISNLH